MSGHCERRYWGRTYILREAGLSCTSLGILARPVQLIARFAVCGGGTGGGNPPGKLPGRGIWGICRIGGVSVATDPAGNSPAALS